jgi:hypothetical protein
VLEDERPFSVPRKKRKIALLVAGGLYVIFGVLAFFNIPGGHEEHHHTFAHNLTHILLGVLLLGITLKVPSRARQFLCFAFAVGYWVIGACGALVPETATLPILPNVIEFHAQDYAVHLATGCFFFALALFPARVRAGSLD